MFSFFRRKKTADPAAPDHRPALGDTRLDGRRLFRGEARRIELAAAEAERGDAAQQAEIGGRRRVQGHQFIDGGEVLLPGRAAVCEGLGGRRSRPLG